VRASANKSRLC